MGLPWEAPCWKAAGKNYNSIIILSVLEEESYSENVVVVKDRSVLITLKTMKKWKGQREY